MTKEHIAGTKPMPEAEKYKPRETRLVAEYVLKQYAPWQKIFSPRLGPIPPELTEKVGKEQAASLYRVYRPYPDALVITSASLILIEGKIRASVEAVGQLLLYKKLIPVTPELAQYSMLRIDLEIVTPWPNPTLEYAIHDYGIKLVVFHPNWIAEYLEHKQNYTTADYRKLKDFKKREGI